jgi:hypothetical protein
MLIWQLSILTIAIVTTIIACDKASDTSSRNPLQDPPIDSARVGSADTVAHWQHRRVIETDIDGDAENERVVLASDVEVREGEPLWEDGHRWALLIEDQDKHTLLYAAFVPMGHVEVAVLTAGSEGRRNILVQERTPQQLRSLEVSYEPSGTAKLVSAAYYQIEQWLPAMTTP